MPSVGCIQISENKKGLRSDYHQFTVLCLSPLRVLWLIGVCNCSVWLLLEKWLLKAIQMFHTGEVRVPSFILFHTCLAADIRWRLGYSRLWESRGPVVAYLQHSIVVAGMLYCFSERHNPLLLTAEGCYLASFDLSWLCSSFVLDPLALLCFWALSWKVVLSSVFPPWQRHIAGAFSALLSSLRLPPPPRCIVLPCSWGHCVLCCVGGKKKIFVQPQRSKQRDESLFFFSPEL